MGLSRRFIAASVPRYLRTTRLGYLPLDRIIGSQTSTSASGGTYVFDVVMLEEQSYALMRQGLQALPKPELKLGPTMEAGFVPMNVKTIIVPEDEPDPFGYAKRKFQEMFGLAKPPMDDHSLKTAFSGLVERKRPSHEDK